MSWLEQKGAWLHQYLEHRRQEWTRPWNEFMEKLLHVHTMHLRLDQLSKEFARFEAAQPLWPLVGAAAAAPALLGLYIGHQMHKSIRWKVAEQTRELLDTAVPPTQPAKDNASMTFV